MSERVFGLHTVAALLADSPGRVREIWVQDNRKDARLGDILQLAEGRGTRVHRVARNELDRLSAGARHQGVVASFDGAPPLAEPDLDRLLDAIEGPPLVLVLDGVQDPHNLGACLRSADAAGVSLVVVPRDRSARLTPTARKVASGAAESVPLLTATNLARTLRRLADRGLRLVGAAGESDRSLFDCELGGPLALVMGGEGKGLRRLTRERCDELVSIPMSGRVESLNVSVAVGVCLFEAVRQRSAAGTAQAAGGDR